MSGIKFAVFNKTEKLLESIIKDAFTGVMLAFCVHISQGSRFWTFITGLGFILFIFVRLVASAKARTKTFRTKEGLIEWVNTLED